MGNLNRSAILLLLLPVLHGLKAQQLPQLSQYAFTDYLYNPAVAGSRPFFELRSVHRNQWVGITDAPRTFMLSANTPLATNMGIGGYLYTDIVGPTRRTGVQFSYAYHLRLTEELRLSLALSAGMVQWLVDGSKITFRDQGDPVLDDQLRGSLMPDAKFAFYLYHERFWFGASAPQLLRGKIYFYDDVSQSMSQLVGHYYVSGGYRFQLGDDWRLEPSFLVKYVDPVPPKVDLTATVHFRDKIWLGGTYRTNDAISVMLGYWHNKQFQIGYAYDITTTNLRNYNNGTHEVMLAVTVGKEPRQQGGTEGRP